MVQSRVVNYLTFSSTFTQYLPQVLPADALCNAISIIHNHTIIINQVVCIDTQYV